MSSDVKHTIVNISAPTLAAAAAYYAYQKKSNWKIILIATAVVWLLVWYVGSRIVEAIELADARPNDINANDQDENFNPERYADRLYEDLYNSFYWFGNRSDSALYRELAGMNDVQAAAINNIWNNKYFHEHNESLPMAIDADRFGGEAFTHAKIFNDRLKRLGAS